MSNPFDQFDSSPDIQGMVRQAAVRHGVPEDLALAVANRESRFRPDAVSPAGAIGVMQLMPGTAKDLGVDPRDPAQNIEGGVRYLAQQMRDFGDPKLALAAYNAGPGNVRKHGGVPPFAETQAYVEALAPSAAGAAGNPFDQFDAEASAPAEALSGDGSVVARETKEPVNAAQTASYKQIGANRNATPGSRQLPYRQEREGQLPGPGEWYVDLQGALKQAPNASVAADAWSGLSQPFKDLGSTVMDEYRRVTTAEVPRSPGAALDRAMTDLGGSARMVGGAVNLLGAPIQAAVRPTARALSGVLPQAYTSPTLSQGSRPMSAGEETAALEGSINSALSAARPMQPRAPVPAKQPAMDLDALKAAKDQAYAKVDASGYRFPNADVKAVADAVGTKIRDMGGPKAAKLLSNSDAMQARLTELAKQPNGVPITQLEKLRGDVFEVLVKPGGPDAVIGSEMRQQIDNLITASGNADVATARELNSRYMKAREVTDRLDSADLRAASTYAGGNKANATRQNLRPLIDPKSKQRIRNLTPAEKKALETVVKGSPAQNAVRVTGKVLDPRGLLGASVQTMFGIPTGGVSSLSALPGMAASELSNKMTAKAVQELLELIARGGAKPAGASAAPLLPPTLPGSLPARALGVAEGIAAPLQLSASARRKEPAKRGR